MFNEWISPESWQVMVVALCSVLHQRSASRNSNAPPSVEIVPPSNVAPHHGDFGLERQRDVCYTVLS